MAVYSPISFFIGGLLIIEIFYVILSETWPFLQASTESYSIIWLDAISSKSNLHLLGYVLYNSFFHFIWFAAIILLLAMIGAIALTIDNNYKNWLKSRNLKYFLRASSKKTIYFYGVNAT
jgi:NADH:ubiquinone oxidoreductase subunit 6 (subunit J)